MRSLKTLFTAEELLHLSSASNRLELIDGKVYEMPPAGGRHGSVAMTVCVLLESQVRDNRLGRVFAAETGFVLRREPDTVRAADVSFVAASRLPEDNYQPSLWKLRPTWSWKFYHQVIDKRKFETKLKIGCNPGLA